jgi:hypothetical protein
MTALKVFHPPNRLALALHAAAPRSVRRGLAEAEANLKTLAGECAAHVDRELTALEAAILEWPEEIDDTYAERLYQPGVRIIGAADVAGMPQVDSAARSMCDVLDGQWTRRVWVRDAIAVHINAMRLMTQLKDPGKEADLILAGLLDVRRKYALPQPAD